MTAPALAFSASLDLSVVGLSARTLDAPHSAWDLPLEPLAWAIVLNGLTAAVVFATALQKGGPTRSRHEVTFPCHLGRVCIPALMLRRSGRLCLRR